MQLDSLQSDKCNGEMMDGVCICPICCKTLRRNDEDYRSVEENKGITEESR